MKFLKFLISDKRGLKYFAFIIIPASIYGMLFIAGNTLETVLFGLTFILIPAFIYVGFYGSSYLNFYSSGDFPNVMLKRSSWKLQGKYCFIRKDTRCLVPEQFIPQK